MEIHRQFIIKALQYAETDERILGMAVGGSWKLKKKYWNTWRKTIKTTLQPDKPQTIR